MQTLLREHEPDILHFAGHGTPDGRLVAERADGRPDAIPMDALAEALALYNRSHGNRLRLVVLNACYSARQAEKLARAVDCVIGAAKPLPDRSAIAYATEFYQALGDGETVNAAFDSGLNQVKLKKLPPLDAVLVPPVYRSGVDPQTVVFAQRLSAAHAEYLRHWFEQKWATMPGLLFGQLDKPVKLLDVYVPLPVDARLVTEDNEQNGVDWALRTGRYEEAGGDAAFEDLGEAEGATRERRLHEWPALNVDESMLAPLAERWIVQRQNGEGDDRVWQLMAEHAAALQPRFVLVGDPGSGKSSFLRHLTLCTAGELLRRDGDPHVPHDARLAALPDWLPGAFTPLYIELYGFFAGDRWALPEDEDAPVSSVTPNDFWNYITDHLPPYLPSDTAGELRRLFRSGQLLIMLDGLDEVPSASDTRRREQVKQLVTVVTQYENRVLVTSRRHAYRSGDWTLDGFGRTELIDLQPAQIEALTRKVFSHVLQPDCVEDQRAFLAELEDVREDLRTNPLFFTLLAQIWLRPPRAHSLPATRGELYRRAVDLLLEDWIFHRRGEPSIADELELKKKDLRIVLQLLALRKQNESEPNDDTVDITEEELLLAITQVKRGRIDPDQIIRHLEEIAGILFEKGQQLERRPGIFISGMPRHFRFLHRSFQEHLAACELLYAAHERRRPPPPQPPFPQGLTNLVLERPDLWLNVAHLAADELHYQKRREDIAQLIDALAQPYDQTLSAGEESQASRERAQAALLALAVATEQGLLAPAAAGSRLAVLDRLRRVATHLLTNIDALPDPAERDKAGKALALLGDERPGVGLRADGLPDVDWVEIPGGSFSYQEGEERTLDRFWIARYPVTYRQFQAFVDDPVGFPNQQWWKGLSASDAHREAAGEQRFEFWNHPRERVSWYDAVAFCRWLTAQAATQPALLPRLPQDAAGMTWQITLPTEEQWEKAARAATGWRYPWGDAYESGYANIDETVRDVGKHYLQSTSAVGMYPQGASPYGLLDMSGNVWEWCLNEYSDPSRTQADGDNSRALRGGSWLDNHDYASAVRRDNGSPHYRFDSGGFRVCAVLVPISSAH